VCPDEEADFKDDIPHVEDDVADHKAEHADADAEAFDACAIARKCSEAEPVFEAGSAAEDAGEVSRGNAGEDDELSVRQTMGREGEGP
jgi:hypothetical protein